MVRALLNRQKNDGLQAGKSAGTTFAIFGLFGHLAPTMVRPSQRPPSVKEAPCVDVGRARRFNDLRASGGGDAGPGSTGAAPRAHYEHLAMRSLVATSRIARGRVVASDGRERASTLSRFFPRTPTPGHGAEAPKSHRRGKRMTVCRREKAHGTKTVFSVASRRRRPRRDLRAAQRRARRQRRSRLHRDPMHPMGRRELVREWWRNVFRSIK